VALIEVGPTENGVVTVLLNRPERRNALSGELVAALLDVVHRLNADRTVRVVLLHGAGKSFCAGGDLAGGLSGGGGAVAAHQERSRYADLLLAIQQSRLIWVAAVHGDALGGGLGLAVVCDLVVADEEARFGTPEIQVGLFPWIILAVLQRNVPRKVLMEMVVLGEKFPSSQALSRGLVNRVVPAGQALAHAEELAKLVAGKAPVPLELGKAAFYQVSDLDTADALRFLSTQLSLNLLTEDALEGVAAFLQKREPTWKGR
jgi:enoyl-CoA hydratase/carnithine racemase